VRLAHAENNDEATLKSFANGQVAADAHVVTDGLWAISLLKRWLLGTHAGAVREKHLQAYLDEFAFRYNWRNTIGVGRIAARVIKGCGPPLSSAVRLLHAASSERTPAYDHLTPPTEARFSSRLCRACLRPSLPARHPTSRPTSCRGMKPRLVPLRLKSWRVPKL